MHPLNARNIIVAIIGFLFLSVAALWAWNTLVTLFDGPQAQYKHVLAAAVMLGITRWVVSPPNCQRSRVGPSLESDKSCTQR